MKLIMTYGLAEQSLYNRENNTSIEGSWLWGLAKKYMPNNTENHISLVGLDEKKRIEIMISVSLFEQLKYDTLFILKAENLRRLRTTKNTQTILEHLCYPLLKEFDNDLDA